VAFFYLLRHEYRAGIELIVLLSSFVQLTHKAMRETSA